MADLGRTDIYQELRSMWTAVPTADHQVGKASMLTESVDGVIGVDTHRDTMAAAAGSYYRRHRLGQREGHGRRRRLPATRAISPTPPFEPSVLGNRRNQ
jgi:hypothetical protein